MLLMEEFQELRFDDRVQVEQPKRPSASQVRRGGLAAMAELESSPGVLEIVVRVCQVAEKSCCCYEEDGGACGVLGGPGEYCHGRMLSSAARSVGYTISVYL
jgi:hypothetical protein